VIEKEIIIPSPKKFLLGKPDFRFQRLGLKIPKDFTFKRQKAVTSPKEGKQHNILLISLIDTKILRLTRAFPSILKEVMLDSNFTSSRNMKKSIRKQALRINLVKSVVNTLTLML
jgi:hypothetical protein